jgi:hypothetical protein
VTEVQALGIAELAQFAEAGDPIGFAAGAFVSIVTTWMVRNQKPESGPLVPSLAVGLSSGVQPWPRHQRRRERYGHHYSNLGSRRHDADLSGSLLGHHVLPFGNGRRHHGRWLAYHQDNGAAHHQAATLWRICRANGGRGYAARHGALRYARQHHSHHYRSHRWSRILTSTERSALRASRTT